MIQFILPAVSALAGQVFGKKGAEAEAEEKLDLIKQLANLTPDQANAVDALKKQSIDEVRTRAALGIGPYGQLPANASVKAQEIRQRRIDAAAAASVTPADQAAAASSPAAMEAIINQKTSEVLTSMGR